MIMVQSIPIDDIVTILPGVIGAGSNPLALNGVLLGQNAAIPSGQLLTFNSADSAGEWFGTDSIEYQLSQVYFNGVDNAQLYPSELNFYAWATIARAAWARGRSIRGMTLVELKAIAGTLTVSINGTAYNAESVDLADASSFTNAAELIATALGIESVANVTWDAVTARFIITVTATPATSEISQITGTASEPLGFASAQLSQGTPEVSLTDTMNAVKQLSLNWALFSVVEDLSFDEKEELAVWSNAQRSRYLGVISDDDPNALNQNDESNFGFQAGLVNYDGIINIYDNNETKLLKAFVMSIAACVDWNQLNGRLNAAFRTQTGMQPTVTKREDSIALLANGYSYYGRYGASGPDNIYNIFYNGQLPGPFAWYDTYVNQVFLNSQMQKALFDALMSQRSIPYNSYGRTVIREVLATPITQALNNGTIRNGVPIDSAQRQAIVQTTGVDVTRELFDNGFYLQILDATPQVRSRRGSPPMNFFYMDGQSIQQINMPSVVIL